MALDVQNGSGETALMIASRQLMASAIRVLASSGAAVDVCNRAQRSALHMACMATAKSTNDAEATAQARLNTVQALLEAGANVNIQDEDGSTPLHYACIRGDTAVTKALLTAGAIGSLTNKAGDTALHIAASLGHVECMKCLVLWGRGDSRQLQPASTNPNSVAFGRRDLRFDFAQSAWQRYQADSGHYYWYNPDTGVSQWTPPSDVEDNQSFTESFANAPSDYYIQEERQQGNNQYDFTSATEQQHDIIDHEVSVKPILRTQTSSGVMELSSSDDEDQSRDVVSPEIPPHEPRAVWSADIEPITAESEANDFSKEPVINNMDKEDPQSRDVVSPEIPPHEQQRAVWSADIEPITAESEAKEFSKESVTNNMDKEDPQSRDVVSPEIPPHEPRAMWSADIEPITAESEANEFSKEPVTNNVDKEDPPENTQSSSALSPRHLAVWDRFLSNAVSRAVARENDESQDEFIDEKVVYDLVSATTNREIDRVSELMNAGVSPNLADDQRRTPLHHAAFAQALDIAQLLYDCGATIDLKDDGGNTPVHVASARGATDVLEFFMSCAADLEAANNDGDRPLHLAAYMGNRDCVQLLLHTGEVSITAMNSLGLTPLGNLVERAPIFIKNRDRTAAGKKPRRIPKEIQDTIRILEEANQDFSTPPTFSAHDRGE